jgi:acetaldehyde dehydrogenase (acetylating)
MVMKFAKKPAARILVNTGSTQGATGGSTGLMPSFTLGCGTWGGSSVSENVSPVHLINVKRVAYGLRDCSTLASSDPTFNYPELTCNSCDSQNGIGSGNENTSSLTSMLNGSNNEQLLKLINELVDAMKRG